MEKEKIKEAAVETDGIKEIPDFDSFEALEKAGLLPEQRYGKEISYRKSELKK